MERQFGKQLIFGSIVVLLLIAGNFDFIRDQWTSVFDSRFSVVSKTVVKGYTSMSQMTRAVLVNDSTVIFTSVPDHGIFTLSLNTNEVKKIGNKNADKKPDYISPFDFEFKDSLIIYADITNTDIRSLNLLKDYSSTLITYSRPIQSFITYSNSVIGFNTMTMDSFIVYKNECPLVRRPGFMVYGTKPGIPISGAVVLDDKIYYMIPFLNSIFEVDPILNTTNTIKPVLENTNLDILADKFSDDAIPADELTSMVKEYESYWVKVFDIFEWDSKPCYLLQVDRELYFINPKTRAQESYYIGNYSYCSNRNGNILLKNNDDLVFKILKINRISI